MKCSLLAILTVVALVLGIAPAQAGGDGTAPYGDAATDRIADRLHGTHRGGWLATTLDCCGTHEYHGRRHAEIVKIPPGHGKRWVGIIHVPDGRARVARNALLSRYVWFARKGTLFVLPLVSSTDTRGEARPAYRRTARWATTRLGDGWRVVVP